MKRNRRRLAKNRHFSLRPVLLAALAMTLLVYLLPLAVVLPSAEGISLAVPEQTTAADTADISITEAQPDSSASTAPPASKSIPKEKNASQKEAKKTVLRCLLQGKVQELELEEYLWGVVAAEMPASFAQDALCAQAVAARTYTLYRMAEPTPNHPEADICGDPGCCQAWISRKERLADWAKSERKECEKKLNNAISQTKGLALYYHDTPIMAAFHAASAGSTKSAEEVWGEAYPYLQEVPSPEDDSMVPNYYSTVTVSREEFSQAFLSAYPKAKLDGDCEGWFTDTQFDEAGLPTAMVVGGVTAPTGRIRTLFGLRSASFSVECQEDSVTFYVTGYGHGVGMSQYGANALAKEGKNFREILEWYYPGTELTEGRSW